MREIVIVIPCFDEAARLDRSEITRLTDDPRVSVILVDDGSRDGTRALIESLEKDSPHTIEGLFLPTNRGKGEAVRAGLNRAIERGATIVGFADADFSTDASEVLRLLSSMLAGEYQIVLGCRVARLGADVSRSMTRHYFGRVFATIAGLTLGVNVYDTQCGAKWFRVTSELSRALETPFRTRWAFDVELLGRLLGTFGDVDGIDERTILEEPVRRWRHVDGSKLDAGEVLRGLSEVTSLYAKAKRASKKRLR